jgi:hypothetical protein
MRADGNNEWMPDLYRSLFIRLNQREKYKNVIVTKMLLILETMQHENKQGASKINKTGAGSGILQALRRRRLDSFATNIKV